MVKLQGNSGPLLAKASTAVRSHAARGSLTLRGTTEWWFVSSLRYSERASRKYRAIWLTCGKEPSLQRVESGRATMGCGDECPLIRAKRHQDWDIPDPKDMPPGEFRTIRDLIEGKVRRLYHS